jgi:purine-binding chemotaxis protein CheW
MSYDTEEIFEEIEFPWLIFKLCDSLYTVNSKYITSIVMVPDEVTFVPRVPDYVIGIIQLRGNVVPLIDLKKLFNIEAEKSGNNDKSEKEMVVVLERDNSFVGLMVDEVLSVENITAFEETEEIKKMCKDGYVKGVAKGSKNDNILLIVDDEKIINLA